uniref:Transcriptional regulator-like domain-containing protein n=1 Tax=Caulobacter sp. (strain K31) TaxID=366602 RepID=B0SV50_CAUSK
MPDGGTWRTTSAYDYIDKLNPADLAWEFLRRNPVYRLEYAAALRGGSLDPDAAAALAQHWGLRFRY